MGLDPTADQSPGLQQLFTLPCLPQLLSPGPPKLPSQAEHPSSQPPRGRNLLVTLRPLPSLPDLPSKLAGLY